MRALPRVSQSRLRTVVALHEVGTLVSMFQAHGFGVRDLESLREHCAITLGHWVNNLTQ